MLNYTVNRVGSARRLGASLLLCILPLLAQPVLARGEVGLFKTLMGEVTVQRNGSTTAPEIGGPVYASDIIVSGAESAFGITLRDNTILSGGAESEVRLDNFRFDRGRRTGGLQATINRGSLAAVSGHLSKAAPDSMRFKTATMTLGVRGTEFLLEVGDSGAADYAGDNVVLLPDFGGGAGNILVETSAGSAEMSEPFETVEVDKSGKLVSFIGDKLAIIGRYCGLLDALPPRSKIYLFYTDDAGVIDQKSAGMLKALLSDLKLRKAPELEVAGYTDSVGSEPANDAESQLRADAFAAVLAQQIAQAGIVSVPMETIGRGERSPFVETDDEVAEPLNRRIEVVLR